MNKLGITLVLALTLTACSSLPSFWDDNQSKAIVDIRYDISNIDCNKPQAEQISSLYNKVLWFDLYTESKGTNDAALLVEPLRESVKAYMNRLASDVTDASLAYCNNKKELMAQQAKIAAKGILGRY